MITVVVAINQLLLSQEFYTPKELQAQMEGVIDYRADVEDISGRVEAEIDRIVSELTDSAD